MLCANSSCTMHSIGLKSSTSTGCASTPCMRSSTTGDRHFLDEMAERIRSSIPGRDIHLVLENEKNESAAAHA